MTDREDPLILANLRYNVDTNGVSERVTVDVLDWRAWYLSDSLRELTFDLIIASDCFYDSSGQ